MFRNVLYVYVCVCVLRLDFHVSCLPIRRWLHLLRCLFTTFFSSPALPSFRVASLLISRTYRAPRKDVIDYTRHSRAEILCVVWIYRAIKMPLGAWVCCNATQLYWWKSRCWRKNCGLERIRLIASVWRKNKKNGNGAVTVINVAQVWR